ncbi:MAG: FGGY-family carbohydrate kinase [Planctomycetaceae bacterium]|jgi:xylulokinase|nr:FGGY-family carbohydrate kinase [Planctomycetaceae bacterium]
MSQILTHDAVFIGVHLAADCTRVSAVTEHGTILAETKSPYSATSSPNTVKGQLELNPEIWWDATRQALGQMVNQLRTKVAGPTQLKAIAVCSNPGAILTVDRKGNALFPAILAEDSRGIDYVKSLNYHGQEHCTKMGFQFLAVSPLAKIAWIKENQPELYENAYFVHQADYIIGKLKGIPDVTEYSLAMKTGCDMIDECWPDWLDYDMHLGVRERLPRLVPLGEKVGTVSQNASSSTGLPVGMTVIMGTTSATTQFLASGARKLGDFNTVLHNGMTISGISPKMIHDSMGQIQIFKLLNHAWFFSVESKTGAEWINDWFSEKTFQELEASAQTLLPTNYLAYPNVRKGETFPFLSGSAEGFISPATDNQTVQFASCLQGTAMFERYCYQKLNKLAEIKENQGDIYSAGEWCSSDSWMQCRADVTGRVNRRMVGRGGAAFGAAMMAAMGGIFHSLEDTAEAMLSTEAMFFPNSERVAQYSDLYENFCRLMEEQGYIA